MKDLHEMTIAELAAYEGAVFHSSVSWIGGDGRVVKSDHESSTRQNETRKIAQYKEKGLRVIRVSFGPIVTHHGIVIDRDDNGEPLPDHAESYSQIRQ